MKQPPVFRNLAIATLLGAPALALAAPHPAWSQQQEQATTAAQPPKVTLSMEDAEIHDVLTKLFQAAKVNFGISPGVQGRITIDAKDMPFEDVLKTVLRLSATPITYTREAGVYLVKPRSAPAAMPATGTAKAVPLPTITTDLQNAPVRSALEQIFHTAKVDFSIDPAVGGTVNLKTTDTPFERTLWLLLRSATTSLTYTKEDGVYRVKSGTLPAEPVPTTPATAPPDTPKPVALPNLTLDLKDTPIRAALEQIFRSAKVDFAIDPTVRGYVNLKVTDMPFENVLKLILRSSDTPLTYTKDSGVYMVRPRTLGTITPAPPAVAARETEAPTRTEYDRIELTYADPVDLAQLLNITMIPIGTRYGLNVPGAIGIIKPGTRGGGTNPGAVGTNPGGGGKSGGTVIGSGGSGNGSGGGVIVGF